MSEGNGTSNGFPANGSGPLTVYRIRNWQRYFENNRSRDLKNAWWVPFPNFMGEDSYAELLEHENGAAHYGVWAACVQIAAKAQMAGSLVRDGGAPHTADSIARICRMPAGLVREACGRLAAIGWMESVTVSKDTYKHQFELMRDSRSLSAEDPQFPRRSRARAKRRGEDIDNTPLPPSDEGGGRRPTKREQREILFADEQQRRLTNA